MRAAFLEAASQLGLTIGAPPSESLASIAEHLVCHVVHFGNLMGCIPVLVSTPSSVVATIQKAGYYTSQLSDSYLRFNAALFRETLNDWGYFGPPSQCPAWYVGHVRPVQA